MFSYFILIKRNTYGIAGLILYELYDQLLYNSFALKLWGVVVVTPRKV